MSGCVTVTGRWFAICSRKSGTTEPDEPSTLPKRTAQNEVGASSAFRARMARSAASFVRPITDTGFTALSVEISTNLATRYFRASSAMERVASVLLRAPSRGFCSTIGTCL